MTQIVADTPAYAGDRLYNIEEARERLGGISRSALYDLLNAGRLRSVHVGKRRFVPASEITAFISDNLAGGRR